MSKISIGLPVYNGERFLKAKLDSILQQTYTNFELIISDNASTDKTKNICIEYKNKDSGLVLTMFYYQNLLKKMCDF